MKLIENFKNQDKKVKIQKIIFIILIIIGIAMRLYKWPNLVRHIECDEAMTAINGKAIADTGKDIYGTSFPVYFRAWNHAEQSAMLTYMMAICIKFLGFNKVAIRLPLLICSIISMFVLYDLVLRNTKNRRWALLALGLVVISPWHYMQSIWSLDCNLMAHFMLWGVYFLLRVLENKKYLYISMIFFGLTMYTYGVALFSIPIFLVFAAAYLGLKNIVNWKDILICILIYACISLPIFAMAFINVFKLSTINLGPVTIEFFERSMRKSDTLIFSSDFFLHLRINLVYVLSVLIYQKDLGDFIGVNSYGFLYLFSTLFLIITLFDLANFWIKNFKREFKESKTGAKAKRPEMTSKKLLVDIILIWFLTGIMQGVLINNSTILRMNMIFYAIIILVAYGIDAVIKTLEKYKKVYGIILEVSIVLLYIISSIFYFNENKICLQTKNEISLLDQGYIDSIEYSITELHRADNIVVLNVHTNEKMPIFTYYAIKYFNEKYNIDLKMYTLKNPEKLEDGYIYFIYNSMKKAPDYLKQIDENDVVKKFDRFIVVEKNK